MAKEELRAFFPLSDEPMNCTYIVDEEEAITSRIYNVANILYNDKISIPSNTPINMLTGLIKKEDANKFLFIDVGLAYGMVETGKLYFRPGIMSEGLSKAGLEKHIIYPKLYKISESRLPEMMDLETPKELDQMPVLRFGLDATLCKVDDQMYKTFTDLLKKHAIKPK